MPVDTFAVLAEPTRRRILRRLRTSDSSVGELVDDARGQPAHDVQAPEGAARSRLRVLPYRRAASDLPDRDRSVRASSTTGSRRTAALDRHLDALERHLDSIQE